MSILNKVENAYLTILRLVALTGATLALILAIGMGISAASKLLNPEPKDEHSTELITSQNKPNLDAFIKQNKPADNTKEGEEKLSKTENKINNSDLDASVNNLSKYFIVVNQGSVKIDVFREYLIKGSSALPEQTKNAYFKSLNEFSAQLLTKSAEQSALVEALQVAGKEKKDDPRFIDFDTVIQWHLIQFADIVDKHNAEIEQKKQEYASAKESGTQELYIAAGSFGAFLLVVFIFIIIKIERNLRGISVINSSAGL